MSAFELQHNRNVRHAILTFEPAVKYKQLLIKQKQQLKDNIEAVEHRLRELKAHYENICLGAMNKGTTLIEQYSLHTLRDKLAYRNEESQGLKKTMELVNEQIKDNDRYLCYIRLMCGGLIWKVTKKDVQGRKVMVWELFDTFEEEAQEARAMDTDHE